jgi:hypothetical protein
MSKFGRLSHFLDVKKRKEIVAFLVNAKNPVFKVYKDSNDTSSFMKTIRSKFASVDLGLNETMLSKMTMVRKGRLILLLDFQNNWDEEDNFEYRIHMDTDLTTLNIHLAKVDHDDNDFPLTVLREEADLFIYCIN